MASDLWNSAKEGQIIIELIRAEQKEIGLKKITRSWKIGKIIGGQGLT